MSTTTDRGTPSKRGALCRLAVVACAIFAGVSIFACGGGDQETGGQTPITPFVTPGVSLPSVPPDSAEKAGLLVYRDTFSSQVLALNLSTGERRLVAGIPPTAVSTLTAFDCTRDGRLIAYTNSAANGTVTIISFAGEGARSQSVEVMGGILGMAWSPAADRIAMTLVDQAGYRLTLLDVATGQTTIVPSLPGTPGAPRWSPDGLRLVVDVNNNGVSDIHVLEIAASTLAKVSSRPSAFTPDWSPDGSSIVFSAGDDQGGLPQIYAVNADGTNERKVTASQSQKWSPRWSLDGSLLSYAGLLIVPAVSALPLLSHNQAVWVSSPDGTNESPVTDLTLDAQPLAWCLRGSWLG